METAEDLSHSVCALEYASLVVNARPLGGAKFIGCTNVPEQALSKMKFPYEGYGTGLAGPAGTVFTKQLEYNCLIPALSCSHVMLIDMDDPQ